MDDLDARYAASSWSPRLVVYESFLGLSVELLGFAFSLVLLLD